MDLNELENPDSATQQAEESAAFEASFNNAAPEKAEKVAEKETKTEEKPEEKPTEPAKQSPAEAAQTVPTQKPDDDLRGEVRKLHGKIGELNDKLQKTLKTKETEGKPAVLSPVALNRLKGEYPELSELLEGDIAEVIASLAQKKADPKEIEDLVSSRVSKELSLFKRESLFDRHQTWETDIWAQKPAMSEGQFVPGVPTPAYQAWLKTMTAAEVDALNNSESPTFVSRKLDQFYDWKGKQAKAEIDKQSRLKAALTPQGLQKGNSQTMSEEEAARKAFDDSFNS
ncbi:MAG: hypothetical protein V4772_08620 [Pseudomonadota bacterium]